MTDKALYLYGIVKSPLSTDWKTQGIGGTCAFALPEDGMSALVHCMEEKQHLPTEVVRVKEQIIMHNEVLTNAMEAFGGVIPLKFGTLIVCKNGKSANDNLKEWLEQRKEQLESIWELTKGKREYGIRIYYQKKQLASEMEKEVRLRTIKGNIKERSAGIAYLMEAKLKSQAAELVHARENELKNDFYGILKDAAGNVIVNPSKLAVHEKDGLLLNVSVLVEEGEINRIKGCMEKFADKGFTYDMAGPFAPYSFVRGM